MEEHGYVSRIHSEADKRVTLVYPTDKMRQVLPDVKRIVEEWNEYLTAGLTEAELAQFRALLERLALRAKKYSDDREEAKE